MEDLYVPSDKQGTRIHCVRHHTHTCTMPRALTHQALELCFAKTSVVGSYPDELHGTEAWMIGRTSSPLRVSANAGVGVTQVLLDTSRKRSLRSRCECDSGTDVQLWSGGQIQKACIKVERKSLCHNRNKLRFSHLFYSRI